MCLIFLAHEWFPTRRLVIAANRDEYHRRETAAAAFWDSGDILAGRDLVGGGTWMGVTRAGRFAALTNFRSASNPPPNPPTRGQLVADFLRADMPARTYLEGLVAGAKGYAGFSLLVGDDDELLFFSNKDCDIHVVPPGVHGLSNHLLNEPWPKVTRGVSQIKAMKAEAGVDTETLFDMLRDSAPAGDELLPDTGVGIARERQLSPMFILGRDYGTRSSTVIDIGEHRRIRFEERAFDDRAEETGRQVHRVGD
ncbi:MAG: NRDE family protein [Pseudomonadota bacterium]